jgi:hypothetical protein
MARIQKKAVINAPFAEIVPSAVNSHPEKWPLWYVGLSAPTMVVGEGEVGTVSDHSFLVAGQSFPFQHRVVESTNDGTHAHWKGEFTGPLSGWHSWAYHLVDGHTEVEVEHEYTLPAELTDSIDAAFAEHMIACMLGTPRPALEGGLGVRPPASGRSLVVGLRVHPTLRLATLGSFCYNRPF